jgi:hypothetical protein
VSSALGAALGLVHPHIDAQRFRMRLNMCTALLVLLGVGVPPSHNSCVPGTQSALLRGPINWKRLALAQTVGSRGQCVASPFGSSMRWDSQMFIGLRGGNDDGSQQEDTDETLPESATATLQTLPPVELQALCQAIGIADTPQNPGEMVDALLQSVPLPYLVCPFPT